MILSTLCLASVWNSQIMNAMKIELCAPYQLLQYGASVQKKLKIELGIFFRVCLSLTLNNLSKKMSSTLNSKSFAFFLMLCSFFWAIPRRLNFMCRRFGTLSQFHLHGWCKHEESTKRKNKTNVKYLSRFPNFANAPGNIQAMAYNVTMRRIQVTIVAVEKQ